MSLNDLIVNYDIKCGYCQRTFDKKTFINGEFVGKEPIMEGCYEISHGICDPCYDKEMTKMGVIINSIKTRKEVKQ